MTIHISSEAKTIHELTDNVSHITVVQWSKKRGRKKLRERRIRLKIKKIKKSLNTIGMFL